MIQSAARVMFGSSASSSLLTKNLGYRASLPVSMLSHSLCYWIIHRTLRLVWLCSYCCWYSVVLEANEKLCKLELISFSITGCDIYVFDVLPVLWLIRRMLVVDGRSRSVSLMCGHAKSSIICPENLTSDGETADVVCADVYSDHLPRSAVPQEA